METQPTVAQQWEEQLRAVRTRIEQGGGRPGVVPAQEARAMTGLAIMEALLDGRLPYAHMAETLDFFLVEVEKGKATFQGTPQAKHLNPMGTVHGAHGRSEQHGKHMGAVHAARRAARASGTNEDWNFTGRTAPERRGAPPRWLGLGISATDGGDAGGRSA